MLNQTLVNLFEELTQHQKDVIKELKDAKDDKDLIKQLDKKLDGVSLFIAALVKFRRTI